MFLKAANDKNIEFLKLIVEHEEELPVTNIFSLKWAIEHEDWFLIQRILIQK
jgi:hypothetical protein